MTIIVLFFPPLSSRLRYLIHKTVEELPELTTFSVGEGGYRRVVVCPSELRGKSQEEDNDDGESKSIPDEEKPVSSTSRRIRAPRRPDKALYTPRAARQKLQSQNSLADQESTTSASIKVLPDSCSSSEGKSSLVLKEESRPFVAGVALTDGTELKGKSNATLSNDKDDIMLSCLNAMSLEDDSCENEDVTCHLTAEIKANLKEAVPFTVQHVQNDFSTYEKMLFNVDDFGHVIEIYDFPEIFKTEDLLDAFREYSGGGMKITWVDDTHALGVFASQTAAVHALSICHPLLKARTLTEGSQKAKSRAVRRAESIQPVKERPKTDSAVMRRMLARALGLKAPGRGRLVSDLK
ncbi:R3H and coiled-coil domain-containing protein 1 isoform X2 [Syngnathoides biaculeatus]|uniref:R3H and coiled-coil domain-containing protein 1 isoform X2 n=1 Tax=Syngnathoides biaculeatus TaxID=300417 RepID=UPI002ADE91CE|nr:R3H and coiled-coil domain-containing protein 1 isoform X2 [Syngnathoides biaculeatus]